MPSGPQTRIALHLANIELVTGLTAPWLSLLTLAIFEPITSYDYYILAVLLDLVTNYHQTRSCQNAPLYSLDTCETPSLSMTGWFWCWKEENIMYKTLCILDKYYVIYVCCYECTIIRYINLIYSDKKWVHTLFYQLLTYTVFVRSYVYLNSVSQCCIIRFTKFFTQQFSNF